MIFREVLGLVDFVDASLNTTQCTRADHSHAILLSFVELFELLRAPHTGFGISLQLGNHSVFFHRHVLLHLRPRDGEVELFLEIDNHATEVLANEVIEELGTGVAVWNVVFGKDLVGEIGTRLESEFFREDEGVVTVEEDFGDLEGCIGKLRSKDRRRLR